MCTAVLQSPPPSQGGGRRKRGGGKGCHVLLALFALGVRDIIPKALRFWQSLVLCRHVACGVQALRFFWEVTSGAVFRIQYVSWFGSG